ncbi:MAG: hypothetical protein WDM81_05805 [Rhizomicrobium sp.]
MRGMRDQVEKTWYAVARREGVSEADCERIAGAFAYPGLDLDHVDPATVV